MRLTFRHVLGSFRILRRRSREVGRPGLAMWAETGEQAAVGVAAQVRDAGHRAEVGALEIDRALTEILADGKITRAELVRLRRIERQARRVADDCHDVTEVMQP